MHMMWRHYTCIERTPANNRLNWDGDYELPGWWIATMKKLGGGANCACAKHIGASTLTCVPNCMGMHTEISIVHYLCGIDPFLQEGLACTAIVTYGKL